MKSLSIISLPRKFLGEAAAWMIEEIWQKRVGARYGAQTNIICRFYPSCSSYAADAFRKYGLARGLWLTIARIRRCNPSNTDSCVDYP